MHNTGFQGEGRDNVNTLNTALTQVAKQCKQASEASFCSRLSFWSSSALACCLMSRRLFFQWSRVQQHMYNGVYALGPCDRIVPTPGSHNRKLENMSKSLGPLECFFRSDRIAFEKNSTRKC